MTDDQGQNITLDVQTVNYIIKLLREEYLSYPAGSPERIALYKFREKLDAL